MTGDFRLRVAFAKTGRARWLAHLELQRALTRMVRRSGLPFAVSQGFNPHMKLATGPALSVGMASLREYFDLHLTSYVKLPQLLSALGQAQAPLLPVLDAGYINTKAASLSAALTVQQLCARIPMKPGARAQQRIDARRLEESFAAIRALEALEVEQKGKTKVFDPATCIPKRCRVGEGTGSSEDAPASIELEFTLRISPDGSLRPDVLLATVFSRLGMTEAPPYELTRTGLFSEDKKGGLHAPL